MTRFRRVDPVTGEIREVTASPSRRPRQRQPSRAPVVCGDWDWFPLSVASGKERLAQLLLEDSGFATFCPRRVEWRNRNRYDRARELKVRVSYTWLPGLVFVGMSAPYEWHKLNMRPILSIVSTTQTAPRAMRQSAIWRLMRIFGGDRFVAPDYHRHMPTGEEFDPGDQVTPTAGPLAGRPLIVSRIDGRTAKVFVEMFGSDKGFEADVATLRKMD